MAKSKLMYGALNVECLVRLPMTMLRSDRFRTALHRRLAEQLAEEALEQWSPVIRRNLDELKSTVRGEPHVGNLDRWERMLRDRDLRGLRHALVGLDDDAIALREVSPLGGLLSQDARAKVRSELTSDAIRSSTRYRHSKTR